MAKCKIRFGQLPLRKLECNPLFTPQALKIPRQCEPNLENLNHKVSLIEDYNFSSPLPVWTRKTKGRREFIILGSLEQLLAFQKVYKDQPDIKVPCQFIFSSSLELVKILSLRLQALTAFNQSHLTRCALVHFLCQTCGYTPAKLRTAFGVKKAKSAEGKQIERDYRIIKHVEIFDLVMGSQSSVGSGQAAPLHYEFFKPKQNDATLTYKMALDVVTILHDEPAFVKKFVQAYASYVSLLKSTKMYPDEITKPVYMFNRFDKQMPIKIAQEVACSSGRSVDISQLVGDDDLLDRRWPTNFDKATNELSLPALKLHLGKKKPSNIKLIFDLYYRIEALSYSLSSYLSRINPADHGEGIRVSDSNIEPFFDTMSNIPKYEDYGYFRKVQEYKMLKYCNRRDLLKCINLFAHSFSFENYSYATTARYRDIYAAYKGWYEKEFEPNLSQYKSSDPVRRPKFEIYVALREVLAERAADDQLVKFGDFINVTFSEVMARLDLAARFNRDQAQLILKYNKKIRACLWDDLKNRTGEKYVSTDEIEARVREMLLPRESRLLSIATQLEQTIQKIAPQISED